MRFMPGPPRTPTPILKARGSWLAKTRDGEMSLPVEAPDCPDWLPAEAKAEWGRIVPQLVVAGVIATVDRALLMAYCEAVAEFVKMAKRIEKDGQFAKTKEREDGSGGNVIQHPALAVRNRARATMLQLAQQFGLSPSARARIKAQEAAPPAAGEGKSRFFQFN